MARRKPPDRKADALRAHGCLHSRPQDVIDLLFQRDDFFDARDLVQIKYEMLRRVRVEGVSVAASAAAFGFSRPTFYEAQDAFEQAGVLGLIPKKPGPRRAHKLSEEVVDFIEGQLAQNPESTASDLAESVRGHFGQTLHPRSIERALARRKKKRQESPR